MPMSWSGNQIVYWTRDQKTAGDIWSVSADPAGDKKPVPILQTPADERNPQVSPDGRWIAYSSNETGRSEVYVRPFPEGTGRIQVSVNGGVYRAGAVTEGAVLHEPRGPGLADGVRHPRERRVNPAGGSTHGFPVAVPGRDPRAGRVACVRRCRPTVSDFSIPQFEIGERRVRARRTRRLCRPRWGSPFRPSRRIGEGRSRPRDRRRRSPS